jgi:hypothetical protein
MPTLPLHTAGRDGRCEHCGEAWPCRDSLASSESLRDQVDDPALDETEQECICTTAMRAQEMHVQECPLFDAWYDSVKPRQRDVNPRCPSCTSPDANGCPPMFHPAHRWRPCEVRMPDGAVCGCMVGVEQPEYDPSQA